MVESLIIVMTIGILGGSFGFAYSGWMGRYNVEKQINEIYSDLNLSNSHKAGYCSSVSFFAASRSNTNCFTCVRKNFLTFSQLSPIPFL
jgi:hypothetical protein